MVRWNTHSKETRLPVAGTEEKCWKTLLSGQKHWRTCSAWGKCTRRDEDETSAEDTIGNLKTSLPNYTTPFPRSIWIPGITEHKGHATQNKRSTEQHSNTPFSTRTLPNRSTHQVVPWHPLLFCLPPCAGRWVAQEGLRNSVVLYLLLKKILV